MSHKTPKNKTPKSRRQQNVPTTDPNFMLTGQSPPVNFNPASFAYQSMQQPMYTNNPFSPPYQSFNQQYGYRPHMSPSPYECQPSQPFSPINPLELNAEFDPMFGQDSQPFFTQGSDAPSEPVQEDSPVEEVAPIKRKYTKRRQQTKKNEKDQSEPWSPKEEEALCKAWVHVSESSISGNARKAQGFWTEVLEYFEKEMEESKRSYDSLNCKWKNRLRPKISQFSAIYNQCKSRHQSGANDSTVYDAACKEYRAIYNAPFSLTECWKILKDHQKWKHVEMPKFLKTSNKTASKKSRSSETTSHGTSDSANFGLDLNDEAAYSEDVEVQEVRPMGRDKAKKASSSGSRSESSATAGIVDTLLAKWTNVATPLFTQRNDATSEYLRIKERELELERQKLEQEEKLEQQRLAQKDKELDLQRQMFEFKQQAKMEKDIMYYNEPHDHYTGRKLASVLDLKQKIKERYNLDY